MSAERLGLSRSSESAVAVAVVATLGSGVALAVLGAAGSSQALTIAGGIAAGFALVLLLAAMWLDDLVLVALSLPLPAFASSESLRLAPAAGIAAAAVAAWGLRRAVLIRRIDLAGLPRGPIAALMGAVMVSAIFAQSRGAALREVINMAFILMFLVVATDQLAKDRRRIQLLVLLITAIMGVSGVLAAVQALGGLPSAFALEGSGFQRATLGFAWPNDLGIFMALGIPLCAYTFETARGRGPRFLALACLGAALLGLVASFSRGSWLAVVASTVVLLAAGQRRFVLRIWLGTLVAALIIEVLSGGAITGRVTSQIGGSFFDQRAALTLAGLLMFQEHPIVGVGPGGFGAALDHYGAQIPWLWDYVGSAHNSYVHMAAETGLVGLVALLAFFAGGLLVLIRAARRMRLDASVPENDVRLQRALLWSFAIASALGLVEWLFAHGVGELTMMIAAMGFALSRQPGSNGWAWRVQ